VDQNHERWLHIVIGRCDFAEYREVFVLSLRGGRDSHDYLTVTDNWGRTGTFTRTVTVA